LNTVNDKYAVVGALEAVLASLLVGGAFIPGAGSGHIGEAQNQRAFHVAAFQYFKIAVEGERLWVVAFAGSFCLFAIARKLLGIVGAFAGQYDISGYWISSLV
tara:strand:- start:4828 stop:5136 length:309 start_codon:yes stop_codon:yes gene_type:complete